MQRRPILMSGRVRARNPGCPESAEAIAQSVARHFQGGTFSLSLKAGGRFRGAQRKHSQGT
jgi:hypothetical protein